MNLNGRVQVIVSGSQISWPTSIVVDYESNTIMWSDPRLRRIVSSSLNGAGVGEHFFFSFKI